MERHSNQITNTHSQVFRYKTPVILNYDNTLDRKQIL